MRRPSQYGINAAAGLVAVGVAAAASLVVTPFLIDRLGAARYGLWTLALAVIQLSILLDFGLTATSRRFQAASLTVGNTHDSIEVLGVSLRLYVPLGLIGLAIAVVFAAAVPLADAFAGNESREFQVLLVAAGIDLMLLLWRSAFSSVAFGANRVDLERLAFVVRSLTIYAVAVGLIVAGEETLYALAAGLVAGSLVSYVTAVVVARILVPGSRFRLGSRTSRFLRPMLRFSVWVILLTAGSVLAVESPKFLIGGAYGPVAVATVAVPMLIVSLGYQVVQAMSAPVFPAASRTDAMDSGAQRMQGLYVSVTRLAMLAAGIGAALLAVFGGDIMVLWVGEEYAEAAPILALLLVGQVFLWGSIPSRQMLTATRSIKGLGVVEIIYGLVCAVGVATVLIGWSDDQLEGLYAAAAVLGIVTALHAGVYVPWFATQQFGLPFAASLWQTHVLPMVWGLFTLGAAVAVRVLLEPDSIPTIAVAVVALAALVTAGGIVVVLEPGDRKMLTSLAGAPRAGATAPRSPGETRG